MNYLTTKIAASRRTDTPPCVMTDDGYTQRSGAPTSYLIRLEGETRWRRLMAWQFSNNGTLFVRINGENMIVRQYDIPEPQ